MGSKSQPSTFDCYANAEPDEPMFVLLARDHRAPGLVRAWVEQHRAERIEAWDGESEYPYGITYKEREALNCAAAMEEWRAAHR